MKKIDIDALYYFVLVMTLVIALVAVFVITEHRPETEPAQELPQAVFELRHEQETTFGNRYRIIYQGSKVGYIQTRDRFDCGTMYLITVIPD